MDIDQDSYNNHDDDDNDKKKSNEIKQTRLINNKKPRNKQPRLINKNKFHYKQPKKTKDLKKDADDLAQNPKVEEKQTTLDDNETKPIEVKLSEQEKQQKEEEEESRVNKITEQVQMQENAKLEKDAKLQKAK